MAKKFYTIGEVAKLVGVSVQAIRMYESKGLIMVYRRASGHRYFTEDDIKRIKCIKRAISEEKISIAGLQRLLALIPCWEIKGCSVEERRRCPAYMNVTAPCWMIKEQTVGRCQEDECRVCPVYTSVKDCNELKEFLKRFILRERIKN